MLKFMRGKSHHLNAERLKLNKELFNFEKTVSHGFPHHPTACAWDAKLQLLAIGTRTGLIKVYGAPGVEFEGKVDEETAIVDLFFLPGEGRIITQCDNSSLYLFELNEKNNKWILEEVKSCSFSEKTKKITTCCLPLSGEHLLIGTDGGNIYLLDVKSFEMTDHIIYQEMVIQNVPDDYKLNPGSVEAIAEHPLNPDKIIIGYNRGLMVLWDNKTLNSENTYVGSQQLESISWHRSGTKFMSSHNDGSYVVWSSTDSSKPEETPVPPYGPFPCKAITKVLWRAVKGGDDFTIFSGGMPRASYGDKNTVTVMCGKKHHVMDFTSKIIDFFTISHADDESEYDNPHTLVVLAEEELVLIDLDSDDWLPFRLPYLSSLHSSAITCSHHCYDVPQDLWNSIVTAGNQQVAEKYTEREFPIIGGETSADDSEVHSLLLTGHEDGAVRFWDASGVALSHLYTLPTANLFVGEEAEPEAAEEEWPPFRKVGSFDPYSDDPRLAVKKIVLCMFTKVLVVAGTAGQIVLFNLEDEEIKKEIKAHSVNIVSDRDNFVWKGHDQLTLKQGEIDFKPGFVPSLIEQLTPPAAVTAIALHTQWGLIAAGTAHGFGLFDYVQKKPVMSKCTLNPHDLMAVGDAAMSRRKSFKKSLRESFRKLRKGRSQRGKRDKTPTRSEDDSKSSPSKAAPAKTESPAEVVAQAIIQETKPVERQVEARSADDSLGSMVRCLYMAESHIINNHIMTPMLWAGTNAGAIFVFTVTINLKERDTEEVACQLGKEIQLKHRAPVIDIRIVDLFGIPLPDPLEVEKGRAAAPDQMGHQIIGGHHKVIICSEEQFKVFTLPTLKPYCKFKLTANEGSRVRKVSMIQFIKKSDKNYKDNCLTCLSNQGEISIFTVPDLHRQQVYQCLKREDINGISSMVFSKNGEAFYLHSSCEFRRLTLSTCHITEAKGKVELPEGVRPLIIEEVVEDEVKKEEKVVENSEKEQVEVAEGDVSVDATEKTESKMDTSDLKIDANVSQDENKSNLDITLDSVKDHLANLSTDAITTVVQKAETSKVVQETVTKVSTVVTSTKEAINITKEMALNTKEITLNAKESVLNAKENFLNSKETTVNSTNALSTAVEETVASCTKSVLRATVNGTSVTSSQSKAPTANLDEFNNFEDGA